MKKSQCYLAILNRDKDVCFRLVDSFLEAVTDPNGNSFNIHFHKWVGGWSATEETTGIKCVPSVYKTRELCRQAVLECCDLYKKLLSSESSLNVALKLKEWRMKHDN